jgi:hypothetical protein
MWAIYAQKHKAFLRFQATASHNLLINGPEPPKNVVQSSPHHQPTIKIQLFTSKNVLENLYYKAVVYKMVKSPILDCGYGNAKKGQED